MRRARLYLAIFAYHFFIKRFIRKSFQHVLYLIYSYKHRAGNHQEVLIIANVFQINRVRIFSSSCNPGFLNGYSFRNLRI